MRVVLPGEWPRLRPATPRLPPVLLNSEFSGKKNVWTFTANAARAVEPRFFWDREERRCKIIFNYV
ncbi:MAG: hypothetical protein RIQ93_804 [Verrucomicrobiota bacterium]